MPTLLKLKEPIAGNAGDWLVVDGRGTVRVVPAEVLDGWMGHAPQVYAHQEVKAPTMFKVMVPELPPLEKEARHKGYRHRVHRDGQHGEREERVLVALKQFPEGLTPAELGDLLGTDPQDRRLLMASTIKSLYGSLGRLDRKPTSVGGRFRRQWRYFLKEGV